MNDANNLQLHYRPVDALIPYCRNARTHSDAQVAQIAASIIEFGWTNPVLVDGDNGVVAGHGRLLAARKLGLTTVPVIELAHLSITQKRAYILADNRIAENAGWDDDLLRLELEELQEADFDLGLTGFDADEILEIMAGEETTTEGQTDEDAAPEVPATPVSKPDDVWVCNGHRVLCGDATDAPSYTGLMAGQKAAMVVTDPPYSVNYANSAKDKMRGTHRPILNDNLGDDFEPFLKAALTPMMAHCDGAIYIAMSSSELDTLQSAFRAAGGKWSTFIIWAKNTFTLGRSDYQRQYEPILYGWPEGARRHWCGDRDQSDVWQIKKPHKNDLHPCLCPGSEVLTDNGWRVIESLHAGERVLTADGMFCPVEWVSSHTIEKPVVRLTVAGVDSTVDATGNHPFLVLRDGSLAWIEASQIIEGDEICSPARAMSESGTAVDCAWNTTSCGNEILVSSQTAIASTTSTTTSKTITFQTCNLSPTLSTSGFTPVVNSAMAFGGSTVVPAGHLNRSLPNTGISVQEATLKAGAADPVMSKKSYSFVLRSVSAIKPINYSGLVWNLSVKDSPTFQTRIGMSHNTMKPVELVERAIRNSSRPGDVVLDPFGGSGTTLIAAEKSGRQARLMELDPKYVDVIVRRWQSFAGGHAVRESDGVRFDDLADAPDAADPVAAEVAL